MSYLLKAYIIIHHCTFEYLEKQLSHSDKHYVHDQIITTLHGYGALGLRDLRLEVEQLTWCDAEDFNTAFFELLQLEIIVFDKSWEVLAVPARESRYTLSVAGTDLFDALMRLMSRTAGWSCGDIMLGILQSRACTKQELRDRLMFVSNDRFLSELYFSVVLWVLIRRERIVVQYCLGEAPLYLLGSSGYRRLRHLGRNHQHPQNISMGE